METNLRRVKPIIQWEPCAPVLSHLGNEPLKGTVFSRGKDTVGLKVLLLPDVVC